MYIHPWVLPLLRLRLQRKNDMGTYAYIVDHDQELYIRPNHINHGSNKLHHLGFCGDLGRLVLHLMTKNEPWTVAVVHDSGDDYETVRDFYQDVTKLVIEEYNEFYLDRPNVNVVDARLVELRYTP